MEADRGAPAASMGRCLRACVEELGAIPPSPGARLQRGPRSVDRDYFRRLLQDYGRHLHTDGQVDGLHWKHGFVGAGRQARLTGRAAADRLAPATPFRLCPPSVSPVNTSAWRWRCGWRSSFR